MDKMNEMTTYRDDQTMTEVAYSSTGMVSYDDERAICDKTEYAMVHNLVSCFVYHERFIYRNTETLLEWLHHLGAKW